MSGSTFILPPGLFITATGTGAGKTVVSRGLAAALRARGERIAALKPIETGVSVAPAPPTDADLLARASNRPELEASRGFYRATLPASPYAVSLATSSPPPDLDLLAQAIADAAAGSDFALIEGAGGLLVPIDRQHTIADLAARLGLPLLIVAPNALGVLSHALTAAESAAHRKLEVAALVLTDLAPPSDTSDPSRPYNQRILAERLPFPVLSFPYCAATTDAALEAAAISANLLSILPITTR